MQNESSSASDFAEASSDKKVAEGKQNLTEEPSFAEATEDRQVLMEILENTRATKKYLKWQLYITIVLVVLPLLAMVFIIPMVLRSLGNAYGGLIQ